jgi:hypothetical protein
MRAANTQIFNAVSMATNQTSINIPLYNVYGWSAQFVFTGSPVGTMAVYVSCDPYPDNQAGLPAPTNFTLLADSTLNIAAAGDITYNVNLAFYNWIKFVYTRTSGSGSLTGRVNLKGM